MDAATRSRRVLTKVAAWLSGMSASRGSRWALPTSRHSLIQDVRAPAPQGERLEAVAAHLEAPAGGIGQPAQLGAGHGRVVVEPQVSDLRRRRTRGRTRPC
jgi:hypothetical protein